MTTGREVDFATRPTLPVPARYAAIPARSQHRRTV